MSHEHDSHSIGVIEHQVAPLLKGLKTAIAEKDSRMCLDILEQLEPIKVNRTILEKTKIGVVVNKLKKNESKKLAEKAKDLVEKWRQAVQLETEKAKNKSNSSAKKIEVKSTVTKSESPAKETPTPIASSPAATKTPLRTDSGSDLRSSNGSENDFRKNMAKRFGEALGAKSNEDDLDPMETGFNLEDELYTFCGGVTADYKSQLRSLLFNLKDTKNPFLRTNVLKGVISLENLVRAKPEELASPELKEWRQLVEKKLTDASLAEPPESARATTDMFRCGKCGQRKCVYHQLQTRSADEPMTTFITCVPCGNKWKQY